MSRISPTILLVIVILAIIFFVFGLLQLLIRCFIKSSSCSSISQSNRFPDAHFASHTFQSQLQQLFRLHDLGLDRAIIDALPIFDYKELKGKKDPFDCVVCLCEFSNEDKLKLLVNCGHAFHIHCIETWLLSNSTCPLCRGIIGFDDSMERRANESFCSRGPGISGERVFSVRLGKFRRTDEGTLESDQGSSNCLDARRCYSMGAFRYIVADDDLQVTLSENGGIDVGKKISVGGRGDSLSVSKIWLWSKKGRFSSFLDGNDGGNLV